MYKRAELSNICALFLNPKRMSLFIRYHLFRLSRRAKPSPKFLHRLESTLFSKAEAKHLHWMHFLRIAAAPALLVVSILTSTATYAYTSDRVLPGHALYPMRQSVEGFEIQLAAVTGMKDRVRLRQLERRARERILIEERKPAVKPAPSKSQPKKPPVLKPAPKPAKTKSI